MADPTPDLRLWFDPDALAMTELPRPFFFAKTDIVAQRLIGMWLARRHEGRWFGGRIVETEAYLGENDPAAHSWRGRRTARVEPMYMEGGHLYVFFIYGMHYCANIVTQPADVAEAVLLRAAEGPDGAPDKLLSGPGRLCSALAIRTSMSGRDLLAGGDVRLFKPHKTGRRQIGVSARIGVDYAGEAKNWPLRFFDLRSAAVSGPARMRNTARTVRDNRQLQRT